MFTNQRTESSVLRGCFGSVTVRWSYNVTYPVWVWYIDIYKGRFCLGMNVLALYVGPNDIEIVNDSYFDVMRKCEIFIQDMDWYWKKTVPEQHWLVTTNPLS